MPTREWFCQVCGNMNGHGKTAIPSSCMRCGLSHTARAYPAYDPRTGKVVDAPSFAAPIASTNYADFLRECAREYEDSAYACDTPLLRGFHAARLEKAKRLRELAARSPAPILEEREADALIRDLASAGRRAWDEGRYVDYQHFMHAIKALRSPAPAIQEKTDEK